MNNLILSAIGILVIGVIIFRFANKKTKEEIELEKRLEDETINVNGKKVTLEEAENETFVIEEKILTEEEIENAYSGDSKELEYINRDLSLLDSWATYEELDGLLERCESLKEYEDVFIHQMSKYKPDLLIGIICVTYTYRIRHEEREVEYQPFFIVQNQTHPDKFKDIGDILIEQIDNHLIIRQPKKATHKGFRKLVMEIEKLV